MERRLAKLEAGFGGGDSCGPLALISPNGWGDDDRASWERAQFLHDEDAASALIEKYAGRPVRPCRCARQHFNIIVVPAPAWVEESGEEERAAWREARRTDAWKE